MNPSESWFASPLASPLLWPTVKVVGSILGAAFVLLLLKERRRLKELPRLELFKRLFTWALIAPAYLLVVLSGRVPTALFVSLMVFQGIREYAKLVGLPRPYRWVLLGMGLLATPAAIYSQPAFYGLPALLLVLATLQPLLFRNEHVGVRDLAYAVFGWGYLAWLLGHFLLLYMYVAGGPGVLLAVGLAVALSDVGAFVLGKSLGGPKLSPRNSPNKTWAGVGGSLLGAALGIGLMRFSLPDALPIAVVFALPIVVALGCLWGDLLESAIKREFRAKDAGAWLPGFGGLLDRIDSLIVVLPLTYYLVVLAGAQFVLVGAR